MNRKTLIVILTCSLLAFALAGWTWGDDGFVASLLGF